MYSNQKKKIIIFFVITLLIIIINNHTHAGLAEAVNVRLEIKLLNSGNDDYTVNVYDSNYHDGLYRKK